MKGKFKSFFKKNEKELFAIAIRNTTYNSKGLATISKNDPWAKEDCWDDMYARLCQNSKEEKR